MSDTVIEILDEVEDIIEVVEEGFEIVGDLRIMNSDASYDVTVPSGSIPLVLEDTPVTVVDENANVLATGEVPSMTGGQLQVTTPPKDVRIINTDSSYDETVSSANSPKQLADITITAKDTAGTVMTTVATPAAVNAEVIVPDITYTEGNGQQLTQPAAAPVVCTPATTAGHIITGATANGAAGAGDDGTTRRGRLVDWFTLEEPNIFGNPHRFTGITGSNVTFPGGIMMDHATFNEKTRYTFAVCRDTGTANHTVAAIIAYGSTLVLEGLAGWSPVNKTEGNALMKHDQAYPLAYAPLNLTAGQYYWSGTPWMTDGGASYYLLFSDGNIQPRPAGQPYRRLLGRYIHTSELNL